MNKTFIFTVFVIFIIGLTGCKRKLVIMEKPVPSKINIIPKPVSVLEKKGKFRITPELEIIFDTDNTELENIAEYFAGIVRNVTGYNVSLTGSDETERYRDCIKLLMDNSLHYPKDEGYELDVNTDRIILKAPSASGLFYGIQTLLQLLPEEIFSNGYFSGDIDWTIPCVKIVDYPRYVYRGMHLDVSRHFFPAEFIKRYIDLIAMHKMNVFHWHLTDDNGWRIEIKKYPKLHEISAWRVDREHENWRKWTPVKEGEKATYGGYYTQEEIEEIVEYAKKRYITVIPEIEMPGHTSEVFAAYPEFACTEGPFHVKPGGYWPITDIFCAGKEETFEFIENVLTEVMELFPSEYIHIGGDEANKARWKECPLCQKRIREEGLKDENELQSYFIRRIEKFLISKGKKLIGWDEILEGGLAPEATVMSWRGMKGGIEAAKQGHDVIMTPTSHCYFDYYQADPEFQPEAIGGFLTLKKVYSLEPTPPELSENEQKYILGAQGNVWSEYIKTPEYAEYMSMPRMCALAEVVWTQKESKSWMDFLYRLQPHFNRLKKMNVNFCRGSFRVDIVPVIDKKNRQASVVLGSEQLNPDIYYTLDGSYPSENTLLYKKPVTVDKTTIIKAGIFEDGKQKEKISEKTVSLHKALGRKIFLNTEYSPRYTAGGDEALLNGIGGSENFNDGYWQGYEQNDLDAVIDLGAKTSIRKIAVRFIQRMGSWIFLPEKVEFSISENNREYKKVAELQYDVPQTAEGVVIKEYTCDLPGKKVRFIRIFAKNIGTCPDWHPGAGGKAWIFADEIIVE